MRGFVCTRRGGRIGLTREIVQQVVHQDAIVRQWRFVQKTRRTEVQPGLGGTRVSSSIRREDCDHILQDVRIKRLDADRPSSFFEAVYTNDNDGKAKTARR